MLIIIIPRVTLWDETLKGCFDKASCKSLFLSTLSKAAHSPERFSLLAEIQRSEAAVVLLMKHPAAGLLQQSPAHLHSTSLCCNVKHCCSLLVNCIYSASLHNKDHISLSCTELRFTEKLEHFFTIFMHMA